MLANKHPDAILAPLAPRLASIAVVPVPGHDHHVAPAFGPDARPAASVEAALSGLTVDPATEIVLIAGSLYLAGAVLALHGELPERSEGRRGGKEGGSTCRTRWWRYH